MNVSLLKIVEKSEEIEKIFIACDTNLQGAENPSWIFAKRVTCREAIAKMLLQRGCCKERGYCVERLQRRCNCREVTAKRLLQRGQRRREVTVERLLKRCCCRDVTAERLLKRCYCREVRDAERLEQERRTEVADDQVVCTAWMFFGTGAKLFILLAQLNLLHLCIIERYMLLSEQIFIYIFISVAIYRYMYYTVTQIYCCNKQIFYDTLVIQITHIFLLYSDAQIFLFHVITHQRTSLSLLFLQGAASQKEAFEENKQQQQEKRE